MMQKSFIAKMCMLLVLGHTQTYTHHIIRAVDKDLAEAKIDLFWSSRVIDYVSVEWYFKMLCDDISLCITFFVFSTVAYLISDALFFVVAILFFIHFIDVFLFMYNYKTSVSVYWILIIAFILSCLAVFVKTKVYKYRSMI